MIATFSKIPTGGWGIRVIGGTPQVGDYICTQSRDGRTHKLRVHQVVQRTGDCCYCAIKATSNIGGN